MKKTWRRIAAGVMALVLALGMTACGQKEQPTGGDAATVIRTAQQAMEQVSSMRYTYAMEMAISAEGESVELSMDGSAEITMDPTAVKMTMNMDMGMLDISLQDVQVYMVPEDGQMVSYVGMDMKSAGQKEWYRTLAEDATISTDQYNALDSFELYMKNGSDFKATGKETVQGASATRYEGVIKSDVLQETLEESGNLDNLTALLGEDYGDALAKMSGIPIVIWINEAGLPVKYVFDMTGMVTEILHSAADGGLDADVSVDKVAMSMEVEGYNDVGAITVPQEVLDSATDLEI